MPYRDGHSRPAGEGEDAASFDVLAQDAVDGIYELVIQASPFADATVDVSILQSPVSIAVKDQVNGLEAQLRNLTDATYETVRGYNQPGRGLFVTLRWAPK